MAFHSGCDLQITGVVPYPDGVELAPLVGSLDAFPNTSAWSVYLRRPLLRLSEGDATLLDRVLNPMMVQRTKALPGYRASLPDPQRYVTGAVAIRGRAGRR
jgi:hypothetical protein